MKMLPIQFSVIMNRIRLKPMKGMCNN
jgi:hypothetical protein